MVGGLIWTFGERVSTQIVATIVTMVIARILSPEHYGVISIVTVFLSMCNIFVTGGFGNAVVRKKDASETDFHTAFFCSLFMALVVYAVLFLMAPLVSAFYQIPSLCGVMRVMGLTLPLASFSTIQQAHLQRKMEFKRYFFASLFGTLFSGVLGIVMALCGFGVWALVAQHLSNLAIDILFLYLFGDWKIRLCFSKKSAFEIISFGWKVLASEFVIKLEAMIRSLVVGKVFGAGDLAFLDQGKKYPELLVDNVNSAINTVMLPVFAGIQDDKARLKQMLRRSVKIGIFCLAPILVGFMGVAENFVIVFLTEKWLPCVPFLQIFCLSLLTRPLETTCLKMILAMGESGTVFKIMVANNIVSVSTLLVASFVFGNMLYVVLGSIAITLCSLCCFMAASRRLVGYTIPEQVSDILPGLLAAFVMLAAVFAIGFVPASALVRLVIQIAVGGITYVLCSFIFNRAILKELVGMVMKKLR